MRENALPLFRPVMENSGIDSPVGTTRYSSNFDDATSSRVSHVSDTLPSSQLDRRPGVPGLRVRRHARGEEATSKKHDE